MPQKDNATLASKVAIRRSVLAAMPDNPVVLETHGGYGAIYRRCYSEIANGVVFDTDPDKAEHLALQRPTWAVYTKYGAAALYDNYLAICREKLEGMAAPHGYALVKWAGRYCGYAQQMTHYAGIFTRVGGVTSTGAA